MRYCLAAIVLLAIPHLAYSQNTDLHVRVLEGEGAIRLPGSRSSHPIAVEVTNEAGGPVEGAAVSFHLPEDGPGGTFTNGLHTDVVTTDVQGRAVAHSLLMNRTPGRFSIRIVAAKGQARAGMVSFQYIASPVESAKHKPVVSRGKLKWLVIGGVAGGAIAAGAIASGRSNQAATATAGVTTPVTGVTIGAPSITVGKP